MTDSRKPRRHAPRRGVTLVEVLVASVLLAVGVGGTMGAIVAAARLRERAGRREALVRVAEARLAWFTRAACASGDTVLTMRAAGIDETWRVTRDGAGARLEGRALADAAGHPVRLSLVHARRCP